MEAVEITYENADEFAEYIDEDMRENMDRTFFRGIGALEDSGAILGALVFELKDSESEEDTKSRIRVFNCKDKDARDLLMKEYAEAISGEDVTESFYEEDDKEMACLLSEYGFSCDESESLDITVSIDDIKKLSLLLKIKKMASNIGSLSTMSVKQYRTFIKNCLFQGKKGLCDDLSYLPRSFFEPEISSCAINDDNTGGIFLMKKSPSGKLFTMLYTAFGPDMQQNLVFMMAYTAQKIVELYPNDTQVVIRRHSSAVKRLTEKFFPSTKGKTVYCGFRKEV